MNARMGEGGLREDGRGRVHRAEMDPGEAEPGRDEGSRVPVLSMILMALFLVAGSIGLLAEWPAGPGNLDWGVWVVLYGGYVYVIGAAILHARTGR